MRTFRLARIAAEAEGLRLRRRARRLGVRMALSVVGLGFLGCAGGFLHIAGWFWLRDDLHWSRPGAALLIAGVDVVLAAFVFLIVAMRSSPGRVELQALEVRQRAIDGVGRDIAFATMLTPTLEIVSRLFRRGKG